MNCEIIDTTSEDGLKAYVVIDNRSIPIYRKGNIYTTSDGIIGNPVTAEVNPNLSPIDDLNTACDLIACRYKEKMRLSGTTDFFDNWFTTSCRHLLN